MSPLPPLAVYVHWPYCARICPYCDFNVVRDRGKAAEQAALAAAIIADLEAQAALTGPRALTSIFLGGGTPSLMDPAWAGRIIDTARRLWPPEGSVEITLEANPTDAEAERFSAFAAAGVGRLSLGLQSLDDAALAFLGRNHDAATAVRAAAAAREAFPRLSIDLIYARPGQSVTSWTNELEAALGLGPEHVSPYQLTIEAGTAFDRAVRRGTLVPPDEPLAADLYETTGRVLGAHGFEAYEVSNHARGPAARSSHNLAYWRGWDYVGAGPGAHGRLTTPGGRLATEAARGIADYIRQVGETGLGFRDPERLTPRDAALERLLMGLRTREGVPLADIAPLQLEPSRLAEFAARGLIQISEEDLIATENGRAVLNRLLLELTA